MFQKGWETIAFTVIFKCDSLQVDLNKCLAIRENVCVQNKSTRSASLSWIIKCVLLWRKWKSLRALLSLCLNSTEMLLLFTAKTAGYSSQLCLNWKHISNSPTLLVEYNTWNWLDYEGIYCLFFLFRQTLRG